MPNRILPGAALALAFLAVIVISAALLSVFAFVRSCLFTRRNPVHGDEDVETEEYPPAYHLNHNPRPSFPLPRRTVHNRSDSYASLGVSPSNPALFHLKLMHQEESSYESNERDKLGRRGTTLMRVTITPPTPGKRATPSVLPSSSSSTSNGSSHSQGLRQKQPPLDFGNYQKNLRTF